MNTSDLEAGDMLLARDNLSSLAMAEDEAVTLRLTNYLVPAAFGLILTLGLLGNFMVIGVVRDENPETHDNMSYENHDIAVLCLLLVLTLCWN